MRALYFCLAGMAGRFRYLNVGLVVITLTLTVAMVASLRAEKGELSRPPG